jgi:hypothetical protein
MWHAWEKTRVQDLLGIREEKTTLKNQRSKEEVKAAAVK